jgi:hypothetical protein
VETGSSCRPYDVHPHRRVLVTSLLPRAPNRAGLCTLGQSQTRHHGTRRAIGLALLSLLLLSVAGLRVPGPPRQALYARGADVNKRKTSAAKLSMDHGSWMRFVLTLMVTRHNLGAVSVFFSLLFDLCHNINCSFCLTKVSCVGEYIN